MEPSIITDWTEACIWLIWLVCVVYWIVKFIRMPTEEQIKTVKECLLNWVVQAEAELGSGTGKVKLSEVYSQFCKSFPFLKTAVPFNTFSAWVDESLDQMREMLQSNQNLREVIGVEEGRQP